MGFINKILSICLGLFSAKSKLKGIISQGNLGDYQFDNSKIIKIRVNDFRFKIISYF